MTTTAIPPSPTKPQPPTRVALAAEVMPGSSCDRPACPAPALTRIDVYGQDFYFCGHHTRELPYVLLVIGAASERPSLPR